VRALLLLPFVLAVAACVDGSTEADAPAEPVRLPPPIQPAQVAFGPLDTRALYDALPVPDTFGAWTPSAGETLAALLVGTEHGDAAVEAMSPKERVSVLRAGLRLPPSRASWECARWIGTRRLDVEENRVAVDHIVNAVLDPAIATPPGEFWHLLEHFSAADIPRLHEQFRGVDPALLDYASVKLLHKVTHAEHLPQVIASLIDAGVADRVDDDRVWLVCENTDRHRVDVARCLVGDAAIDAQGGTPAGLPPALRASLRRLLAGQEIYGGARERYRNWVVRWLRDSVPDDSDASILLRVEDAGWGSTVALWSMRHLRDPDTHALLRERAKFDDPSADTDPSDTEIAARASLAARGDAESADWLRRVSVRDGLALALYVELWPESGVDAVTEVLLDPGADADWEDAEDTPVRRCLSALWGALESDGLDHGVSWRADVFAGLEERVLASDVPPSRVLGIADVLPTLWTERVARWVVERLGDAPPQEEVVDVGDVGDVDDVVDGEWHVYDEYALLELATPDRFRATLRRWATDERPGVRATVQHLLLVLGDPESGPMLVEALRAGGHTLPGFSNVGIRELARSPSPVVDAYLREVATTADPSVPREMRWDALRGLAILGGLPESVEFDPAWDNYVVDDALEAEVRDLVLRGRAVDAFVRILEASPDVPRDAAGDVDDPRVTRYLRRLQRERHLKLYSWATAELAIQGDPAARAEQWAALKRGLYRWCDNVDERQATIGYDLGLVPHWAEFIEASDCQEPTARVPLEHLFDVDVQTSKGYGHTGAAAWRAWRRDRPGAFAWSRITEQFVPVPR